MKAPVLILFLFALGFPFCYGTTYFVSPQGSDANTGTITHPFATLQFAIDKTVPGDMVYLRGGTYSISTQLNIRTEHSGTSSSPIKLWAYNNEKPLLDFSSQPLVKTGDASLPRGFYITGDYWHLKGFEIYAAADNGIKLEGNYNTIELLVIHHCGDSGIQLGFGHTTNQNNPGHLCAYNKIIHCDSYRNYDYDNYGSDADGFACKMHNGKGNLFYGCRAWENADDAWDLFETDWPVGIYYCWAWHSGDKTLFLPWHKERTGKATTSFQGNGNGIKLGGDGAGGQSKGTHVVGHCISFNHNKTSSVKGFDQNSHKGGILLYHCLGWNNGYNYMFETSASGASNTFINNVSIKGAKNDVEIVTTSNEWNNSWNLPLTANLADYETLTEDAAKAPRQSDGSLPNNGFARLVGSSDLIDKGRKIDSIAFHGMAPDLGPYEYPVLTDIEEQLEAFDHTIHLFPNPSHGVFTLLCPGAFSYSLVTPEGIRWLEGDGAERVLLGESLPAGFYILHVKGQGGEQAVKMYKR